MKKRVETTKTYKSIKIYKNDWELLKKMAKNKAMIDILEKLIKKENIKNKVIKSDLLIPKEYKSFKITTESWKQLKMISISTENNIVDIIHYLLNSTSQK